MSSDSDLSWINSSPPPPTSSSSSSTSSFKLPPTLPTQAPTTSSSGNDSEDEFLTMLSYAAPSPVNATSKLSLPPTLTTNTNENDDQDSPSPSRFNFSNPKTDDDDGGNDGDSGTQAKTPPPAPAANSKYIYPGSPTVRNTDDELNFLEWLDGSNGPDTTHARVDDGDSDDTSIKPTGTSTSTIENKTAMVQTHVIVAPVSVAVAVPILSSALKETHGGERNGRKHEEWINLILPTQPTHTHTHTDKHTDTHQEIGTLNSNEFKIFLSDVYPKNLPHIKGNGIGTDNNGVKSKPTQLHSPSRSRSRHSYVPSLNLSTKLRHAVFLLAGESSVIKTLMLKCVYYHYYSLSLSSSPSSKLKSSSDNSSSSSSSTIDNVGENDYEGVVDVDESSFNDDKKEEEEEEEWIPLLLPLLSLLLNSLNIEFNDGKPDDDDDDDIDDHSKYDEEILCIPELMRLYVKTFIPLSKLGNLFDGEVDGLSSNASVNLVDGTGGCLPNAPTNTNANTNTNSNPNSSPTNDNDTANTVSLTPLLTQFTHILSYHYPMLSVHLARVCGDGFMGCYDSLDDDDDEDDDDDDDDVVGGEDDGLDDIRLSETSVVTESRESESETQTSKSNSNTNANAKDKDKIKGGRGRGCIDYNILINKYLSILPTPELIKLYNTVYNADGLKSVNYNRNGNGNRNGNDVISKLSLFEFMIIGCLTRDVVSVLCIKDRDELIGCLKGLQSCDQLLLGDDGADGNSDKSKSNLPHHRPPPSPHDNFESIINTSKNLYNNTPSSQLTTLNSTISQGNSLFKSIKTTTLKHAILLNEYNSKATKKHELSNKINSACLTHINNFYLSPSTAGLSGNKSKGEVDVITERYRGRYSDLFRGLVKKYGWCEVWFIGDHSKGKGGSINTGGSTASTTTTATTSNGEGGGSDGVSGESVQGKDPRNDGCGYEMLVRRVIEEEIERTNTRVNTTTTSTSRDLNEIEIDFTGTGTGTGTVHGDGDDSDSDGVTARDINIDSDIDVGSNVMNESNSNEAEQEQEPSSPSASVSVSVSIEEDTNASKFNRFFIGLGKDISKTFDDSVKKVRDKASSNTDNTNTANTSTNTSTSTRTNSELDIDKDLQSYQTLYTLHATPLPPLPDLHATLSSLRLTVDSIRARDKRVCLYTSVGEVVASVCCNVNVKPSSSDDDDNDDDEEDKIKYFLLDCRPQPKKQPSTQPSPSSPQKFTNPFLSQSTKATHAHLQNQLEARRRECQMANLKFPQSLHFPPGGIQDPDVLGDLLRFYEPLRASIHFCIMCSGSISGSYTNTASNSNSDSGISTSSSSSSSSIGNNNGGGTGTGTDTGTGTGTGTGEDEVDEEADAKMIALFFIKRGFPYISIMEGGFCEAYGFLEGVELDHYHSNSNGSGSGNDGGNGNGGEGEDDDVNGVDILDSWIVAESTDDDDDGNNRNWDRNSMDVDEIQRRRSLDEYEINNNNNNNNNNNGGGGGNSSGGGSGGKQDTKFNEAVSKKFDEMSKQFKVAVGGVFDRDGTTNTATASATASTNTSTNNNTLDVGDSYGDGVDGDVKTTLPTSTSSSSTTAAAAASSSSSGNKLKEETNKIKDDIGRRFTSLFNTTSITSSSNNNINNTTTSSGGGDGSGSDNTTATAVTSSSGGGGSGGSSPSKSLNPKTMITKAMSMSNSMANSMSIDGNTEFSTTKLDASKIKDDIGRRFGALFRKSSALNDNNSSVASSSSSSSSAVAVSSSSSSSSSVGSVSNSKGGSNGSGGGGTIAMMPNDDIETIEFDYVDDIKLGKNESDGDGDGNIEGECYDAVTGTNYGGTNDSGRNNDDDNEVNARVCGRERIDGSESGEGDFFGIDDSDSEIDE